MVKQRNSLTIFQSRRPTLGDQVAALGTELAEIAGNLRGQAAPKVHDAAEAAAGYAHDLGHQLEPAARDLARRARGTAIAIRDNPAPAIIAVATLILVASLFTRRQ